MAFILSWSSHKPMPFWTLFNQNASTVNPEKTSVGYLLIIQSPASELDTLNTVIKRVLHVAKSMEQQHVVLTVDEALYPKLLELKWSVEEYKYMLIRCLGGLHIVMNFQGVMGRHMSESGLSESCMYIVCSFGKQCCAAYHGRKGICTCHHDPQTYPTGYLATTPPTALYVPGWGWCCTESRTLRGLHIHWRRSQCTNGRQTDYRQFSGRRERVCCSSCTWKPECWILVGLYDYGQHPTLLDTSATWWIMASPLICFQVYATIPLHVRPC